MFYAYVLLLVFCLFFYYQKKNLFPDYYKYIHYLLVFVLLVELIKEFFKRKGININPLNHFYEVIELILLSFFFYYLLDNKKIKKLIISIGPLLLVAYIVISIFVEGVYNNNTFSFISESIVMSFFSAVFFFELYISTVEKKVIDNPAFWICAGILIYNCGTFFQMGLHNYLEKRNHTLAEQLKIINYVLNYFLYATYLAGFICIKK